MTRALQGVRIIEFGGYAAGPHIGKMLANFGATVVHVESRARPDGFRMQYPPYKDGKPGIDRGGCFAFFNDSKLGVTLDVKNPRGLELARRLAAGSDVLIENMRPGVIARIGLGYEALKKQNPRLIMLSTCNMGQTGPRADTPGFGSQLTALAGMCHLTGEPGGPPMLLYGPYIDFIASTVGAVAVLAALERRHQTGEGAYIDISQYESGLMFLAGELLEYHTTGKVAERAGNDDPDAMPHGAFACGGGGWLAVSCWSAAEFARFAQCIGRAGLRREPQAIEEALSSWLRERSADAAARALQAVRVHAHAVATVGDLFTDPQLAARAQWQRKVHPVIGEHSYCGPPFVLSETPGEVTRPAPTLGADNEAVFRNLLGLTAEEYAACEAAGAFA
ncbi:MAG: CoA-transferase [Betaproteobacteria bacterium RIFCSPLOWO2_12_FULL_65_14]|nr:MAG: CoA-transferase [Betaproteobacteria bacterium RIFCSPLOWO2_12_FULL_65_14]